MGNPETPHTIEVIITYLEMRSPPDPRQILPDPGDVEIRRVEKPEISFYRFLYDAVGGPWEWTDRRKLSDEELEAIVQNENVHVHVLYANGAIAGFAELDYRQKSDVQLVYFGLLPTCIGRGLGRFFLDRMIGEAWRHHPERVWVHTCTLDHPRALPLYKKAGFIPYKTERKTAVHNNSTEKQ